MDLTAGCCYSLPPSSTMSALSKLCPLDSPSVFSDGSFASAGEMLSTIPCLLKLIHATSPVASQQCPDHTFIHGSTSTHDSAIACGHFAAAKESNNASTFTEHFRAAQGLLSSLMILRSPHFRQRSPTSQRTRMSPISGSRPT
ncbi:hypothetical protein M758_2G005800 [Ceratodon purpureus]|nr:hypothetical protein M758_2G005800 [Ceratodon purpureus]